MASSPQLSDSVRPGSASDDRILRVGRIALRENAFQIDKENPAEGALGDADGGVHLEPHEGKGNFSSARITCQSRAREWLICRMGRWLRSRTASACRGATACNRDVAANLPGSGPILISKDFGKGSNEPTGRVGAARR
jgi:hypothetical protein